jgi:hypothetical protein
MTVRRPFHKLLSGALLALLACAAMAPGAGAATPAPGNPIEGVWSFTGGEVAIAPLSSGNYQGTIVSPTTFAICPHAVGEVMWTGMQPQADGSFRGLHQWFTGGEKCELNPLLGKTAWRVIAAADGSRQLIVCFSKPGDDSQPTIAPDGASAHATYGCTVSNPVAPLPSAGTVSFDRVVGVPPTRACLARRSLKIVLRNPRYDPLREVLVRVKGKKVVHITDPARLQKPIRLNRLPSSGTFKVGIVATTALGKRISGSRTYRPCSKGPGKIRV